MSFKEEMKAFEQQEFDYFREELDIILLELDWALTNYNIQAFYGNLTMEDYYEINKNMKSIDTYQTGLDRYIRKLLDSIWNKIDFRDYDDIRKNIKNINQLQLLLQQCIKKYCDENTSDTKKADSEVEVNLNRMICLTVKKEFLNEFQMHYFQLQKHIEGYFTLSLEEYILKESSMLHLVLTNNTFPHIRLSSYDSYFFLCQFHCEKTPSMKVTNQNNQLYCYGCGIELNPIEYISQYESLSKQDAIALIAKVYMIDIKENPFREEDVLVQKYRQTLLKDGYYQLLQKGNERAKHKEKTYRKEKAMSYYEKCVKTIERVRNHEYISYEEVEKSQLKNSGGKSLSKNYILGVRENELV